jgi:hypothetical protein
MAGLHHDYRPEKEVAWHPTEFLRTTSGALIRKSEFRGCR